MRIAQVFNRYRTAYGGEYGVVRRTELLLQTAGHQVIRFEASSADITTPIEKLKTAFSGVYSRSSRAGFGRFLERERPDIVHVHNLYPILTPSILLEANSREVPAVMTVHNQGLTCPVGTHFVNGEICERCAEGNAAWCVLKNCAHGVGKSAAYALRFTVARRLGWFRDHVDRFIALTPSAGAQLQLAGIRRDQISIIPNGIRIPPGSPAGPSSSPTCLFVGRLIEQKGARTFIQAALQLPDLEFVVIGDGPLGSELADVAPRNVRFLGRLSREATQRWYAQARLVVFPSLAYEGLPLVVLEAMSHGLPVVASDLRGPADLVRHEETGFLVQPGDVLAIVTRVRQLMDQPGLARRLGSEGHRVASAEYSEARYLQRLEGVYRSLREHGATDADSAEGSGADQPSDVRLSRPDVRP